MWIVCLLAFTAAAAPAATKTVDLVPGPDWKLTGVDVAAVEYMGKKAVRVAHREGEDGKSLVILPGIDFADGVIEYEFAGDVRPNAPPLARGFTGLAFRVQPGAAAYECFYQRPLNARAANQEQRNHSLQYIGMPEYPWQRLRKETPERYESYADMVPGEWTRVRIEVKGTSAKLFINGVSQPSLNQRRRSPGSAGEAAAV